MAFDLIEESAYHGAPITLYQFTFGVLPEDRFCYTDSEVTQVWQQDVYKPVAISRGEIESNGSLDNTAIDVNMALGEGISEIFRMWPPSYVMSLLIWQGHSNDPDGQFKVIWAGRAINCAWTDSEVTLTCEPVATSLKRPGLRRNYQRMCPHALYGPQCKAPKIASDQTVAAVYRGSNVIDITNAPGPEYLNGQAEYVTDQGRRQILTIIALNGVSMKFQGTPIGLVVGAPIKLYRGCDHTLSDLGCGLHNNYPNYGGQPWIPLKNPTNNLTTFN